MDPSSFPFFGGMSSQKAGSPHVTSFWVLLSFKLSLDRTSAVYLGGLTAVYGGYNPAVSAVLGFIGIFLPGIVTVHGTMGI